MYNEKHAVESIRPLKDLVKVKIHVSKDIKTKSGLLLKDTRTISKYFDGIVVYEAEILGMGTEAVKIADGFFKVGDKVILDRMAGTKVQTEGDSYIKLVPVSMIICKNEGEFDDFNIVKLKPFYNRVLVSVDSYKETTPGGIIIPNTVAKDVLDLETIGGTVIAVAPDVEEIVAGDYVVFEDMQIGVPIRFENKDYKLIVKHDLLAIIER